MAKIFDLGFPTGGPTPQELDALPSRLAQVQGINKGTTQQAVGQIQGLLLPAQATALQAGDVLQSTAEDAMTQAALAQMQAYQQAYNTIVNLLQPLAADAAKNTPKPPRKRRQTQAQLPLGGAPPPDLTAAGYNPARFGQVGQAGQGLPRGNCPPGYKWAPLPAPPGAQVAYECRPAGATGAVPTSLPSGQLLPAGGAPPGRGPSSPLGAPPPVSSTSPHPGPLSPQPGGGAGCAPFACGGPGQYFMVVNYSLCELAAVPGLDQCTADELQREGWIWNQYSPQCMAFASAADAAAYLLTINTLPQFVNRCITPP